MNGSEKRPVVICNRCRIPIVLEADGTLPTHWPSGWPCLCDGAGTREWTKQESVTDRPSRAQGASRYSE